MKNAEGKEPFSPSFFYVYILFPTGQEDWTNKCHKAPPARTTKAVYREQPYSRY